MHSLKCIGGILFITSWCLITPALADPSPECGEGVSLGKLITNPDTYHGKTIWVVAHITIDFENMTACPSEYETQMMKKCLWLDIVDGPYKTEQEYARYEARLKQWKRFDRQTVAVHATFDKNEKGHFSMLSGGLRNVTEVSGRKGGWSFATSTAVQYNCLTDK
jgi:hypothetical protein